MVQLREALNIVPHDRWVTLLITMYSCLTAVIVVDYLVVHVAVHEI